MTAANTLIDNTVQTARRTRRAYLGVFGLTYDFAAARADKRREQMSALLGDAIERGEVIETDAKSFFEKAKTEARELTGSAVADVEEKIEDAKEAVQEVKEEIVLTAKKAAKQEELTEKVVESDKYASYVEKVHAYDQAADPLVIKKIVDHLGIALQSRDGKFVACSDEAERKTVAQNWLTKKLGLIGDAETLDAKVLEICEMMKADRMKDRVVFYYLAAKANRKLGTL